VILARESAPAPPVAEPVSKPLSVLVVDDHYDTAESLAYIMRMAGYETRTAYTPAGAAQVVRAGFRPDAIVMDIGLPDIDGFSVAEELTKVIDPRPLLVAVTGFQNLGERARQEGFDLHFIKPVDPATILEVLAAHAERLRREGGIPELGNGKASGATG
jgi:CheY-like chemotaxis protein